MLTASKNIQFYIMQDVGISFLFGCKFAGFIDVYMQKIIETIIVYHVDFKMSSFENYVQKLYVNSQICFILYKLYKHNTYCRNKSFVSWCPMNY